MSDHNLKLDVQKIAICFQAIRNQMDTLENLIQEALLEEETNDGDDITVNIKS